MVPFLLKNEKSKEEKIKEKIQKGWHLTFTWLPTSTLDGKLVWFDVVERKYYSIVGGRRVVKKNLNLSKVDRVKNLKTMHRLPGSNKEKKIYSHGRGIFRDPNEMFKDLRN